MSTHHLAKSAARVLSARCVRLYRRFLALPAIFLVLLGWWVSGVRGERQLSRKRSGPELRSHTQGSLTPWAFVLRLEGALYRLVIVPLVAFLPAPLAYGVACLRGDWRYRWDKPKREDVMRCLKDVLGDQLSLADRTRITRDFFRHRACQQIDVMRLAGKGRALARLVEIRGMEHVEAALAAGKGAILCCAHFGSFNCGYSLLGACGFPITAMGRWASNNVDRNMSLIERILYRVTGQRLLARHRRRTNIEPFGQLGVGLQAATILRQNELIATGIDAPLLDASRSRGVPMDFLNGQAHLLPGVTTIAQLIGAPVLMTFMHRSADWHHQVLEISSPVPMDGDAVTAFKRCLAMVEASIHQDPAHWSYWNTRDLVTLGLLPEEAMNSGKSSE